MKSQSTVRYGVLFVITVCVALLGRVFSSMGQSFEEEQGVPRAALSIGSDSSPTLIEGPNDFDAEASEEAITNARDILETDAHDVAKAAADASSTLQTWFIDASADFLYPRRLVEGTFDPSTYRTLIETIEDRRAHVSGAAADGATRVWVMVECPGPGRVTFSLGRAQGDGVFSRAEVFNNSSRSMDVGTYAVNRRHFGIILYVTPKVYGRHERSPHEHSRTISIDTVWDPDKSRLPDAEPIEQRQTFTILRPPVVLVHGTGDDAEQCWRQFPQGNLTAGDYPPGHRAMFDMLVAEGFVLPNGKPAVFTVRYDSETVDASKEGKYTSNGRQMHERTVMVNDEEMGSSSFVNLAHVLWENPGGIRAALAAYREAGIAAAQADVVSHGAGGLLARLYIRGAHLYTRPPQRPDEFPHINKPVDQSVWYFRPENFMEGDVHRLITIGTPHKGVDDPGMLIPERILAESREDRLPEELPTLRASDLGPGDMGALDHRRRQMLLYLTAKHNGMGGALHDQQPNSTALNAIGPTAVPAHAIATVCEDEDLDAFKGAYWQRTGWIYLLSPDETLEQIFSLREHGPLSLAQLQALVGPHRRDQSIYACASPSLTGTPALLESMGTSHRQVLSLFRSICFGNTANDGTVRQESALGGLEPDVDATVMDHVVHDYAPTYPSVQTRVLELLRGGFRQFNTFGFLWAGGPVTDMPPPHAKPVLSADRVAVTIEHIEGTATRVSPEQQAIEPLSMETYLATQHTLACTSGRVELNIAYDGAERGMVKAVLDATLTPTLVQIRAGDRDADAVEALLCEGTLRIDREASQSGLARVFTPAAMIENTGTSYSITHNHATRETDIVVHEGIVRIYPRDGSPSYALEATGVASHATPDDPVVLVLDSPADWRPPVDPRERPVATQEQPFDMDVGEDTFVSAEANAIPVLPPTAADDLDRPLGELAASTAVQDPVLEPLAKASSGDPTERQAEWAMVAAAGKPSIESSEPETFDRQIMVREDGVAVDITPGITPVDPPMERFETETIVLNQDNSTPVAAAEKSQDAAEPSPPDDINVTETDMPADFAVAGKAVEAPRDLIIREVGEIEHRKGIDITTLDALIDAEDGPFQPESSEGQHGEASDMSSSSVTIDPPLETLGRDTIETEYETAIEATTGNGILAPPQATFDMEAAPVSQTQPWAEAPGEGLPQILRTLVYHQLFDSQGSGLDSAAIHGQPVLSADGSRAVFSGKGVYVIDYDGGYLRRVGEVEASAAYKVDISPDGQWVAFYDDMRVYAAPADGAGQQQLLESSYGAFYGLRVRGNPKTVFLVCARPAKVRTGTDAPWEHFGNGIWGIDPETGRRRHLVDFAQMAREMGHANTSVLTVTNMGQHTFDVSEDGRHLVFGLYFKTDRTGRVYGWSEEKGIRELVRIEENTISSLAISGDGRTVALVTRGRDGGLYTIGFDGSKFREILTAADTNASFTDHECLTRLNHDGSFFLHGMDNLLVRLSDGLVRNIGPAWDSRISSVFGDCLYRLTMNRDATRFIFISRQKSGRPTLSSLTVNASDPGDAPRITDIRLDPTQGAAEDLGPRLTTQVSSGLDITHARVQFFRQARLDLDAPARDLRNEGRQGDLHLGDNVYTLDDLLPASVLEDQNGSPILRVLIQGYDEQDLAHATAVDYGPWPVER